MEKTAMMRSLYRSICCRSLSSSAAAATSAAANRHQHLLHGLRYFHRSSPSIFTSPKGPLSECQSPFGLGFGNKRYFSEDVSHLPDIKDPEVHMVFKDFMAASWDDLPDSLVNGAKKALSKNTDDKAGQEALANVFRAAEAAEEFSGILVSLRMAIDDNIGLSGENVKPLSDEFVNALKTAYQRYTTYLDSFGPHEEYLRKKVETELGTKMIHLKMRCAGIGSEWGKVTVLGTSGISGSYVEQRA